MKVSRLLEGYFVNDGRTKLHESGFMLGLPIVPKKSEWKLEGDVLLRKFKFKDRSHLKDFVVALLELEDDTNDECIVIIESSTVRVSCAAGSHKSDDFLNDLDGMYAEITGE